MLANKKTKEKDVIDIMYEHLGYKKNDKVGDNFRQKPEVRKVRFFCESKNVSG